jgi:flagellar biosynthesis protein FlhB
MDSIVKQVSKGITQINTGIYISLFGAMFFAQDNDYILTDLNAIATWMVVFVVSGAIMAFIIARGLISLNQLKPQIKKDRKAKVLFSVEIFPNVLGYILMAIGIYLMSFYQPQTIWDPQGSHEFMIHQYQSQGFYLFFAGIGLELLAFALYYYLLPKQVIEQQNVRLPEVSVR